MEVNTGNILLVGAILLFASIVVLKAGYRFGLPALLLFLGVGMAFGSEGVGFQFDNPAAAQFIGMMALSIILFSGGMDTKLSEIRPIMGRGLILSTVGVVLTMLFVGCFVYGVSHLGLDSFVQLSWAESMLLGAIVSSTDSASVFSILSTKKMGIKNRLGPLLELESGSNDPMAYMLTLLLVGVVVTGEFSIGGWLWLLTGLFVVGALAGWLLGRLGIVMMRRLNLDNKSLYSILLLSFALFTFSFTDLIKGNGYLAVYIAGVTVGNGRFANRKAILTFFDGLAWLFQIVMFLALGLLVNPSELWPVAWVGLFIAVFLTLVARPAAVFLSLWPWGKKIGVRSKVFVSWVGLRGAVPIIFATYPLLAHAPNAQVIFNVVFFITLLSLSVQGTTVGLVARWLKLGVKQEQPYFNIDLPEHIRASLAEVEVDESMLENGLMIKELGLPKSSRVVMIYRDRTNFVPRGSTELKVGDKLLIIADKG